MIFITGDSGFFLTGDRGSFVTGSIRFVQYIKAIPQ